MDRNEEEAKRASKIHQPNQVESDFALAVQLQEEESESDSEEDDSDETYSDDGYEFFDSLGLEEDLGFLEDEEMEEEEEEEEDDDIDPDEMSYEELMELGEAIGAGRRGLSEKEISGCSRGMTWSEEAAGIDRCVVCQVEYEQGEGVVALNGCQHPYHLDCISKWLRLKNICPICSNQPV